MKEKLISNKGRGKALGAIMAIAIMLAAFAPIGFFGQMGAFGPMAAAAAGSPGFKVEQAFVTSSSSADSVFAYRLRPLGEDNPMPAGSAAEHTFTIKGDASADIALNWHGRPGVFSYELSQVVAESKKGYTYDKRVYTIDVYINAYGDTEVIAINGDGTKTADIEFKNSYSAHPSDPALMADPPVRKTVSGNPGADSVFTFKLKAKDASQPMPEGSAGGEKTLTITGQGEKDFGTWSYDKAGTYYYTVFEVNTGEKGYTYDTMVYTITDTVSDAGGQLVLSRVVSDGMNKQVQAMAFVNEYRQTALAGFSGGTPKTGDEMDIALYVSLLALGGGMAISLAAFLAAGRRRRKAGGQAGGQAGGRANG